MLYIYGTSHQVERAKWDKEDIQASKKMFFSHWHLSHFLELNMWFYPTPTSPLWLRYLGLHFEKEINV